MIQLRVDFLTCRMRQRCSFTGGEGGAYEGVCLCSMTVDFGELFIWLEREEESTFMNLRK